MAGVDTEAGAPPATAGSSDEPAGAPVAIGMLLTPNQLTPM
jgi:hypothetical protein